MTWFFEVVARLAAIGIGGWLAYTEATGTYEFYLEQAGGVVTFLVRATVGITLATAILPYFLSQSIKRRRFGRALSILLGFLLCVSVILVAGVSRTGAPQDVAKAKARETKRKLDTATANVKDAETALATGKTLVEGECKTGVGKECKRLAGDSKGTLDTAIQLRTKLSEVKEVVEDNTPKRLSAMTGGIVSPQQVETIQPLLMPVTLSFVAGLLLSLGLDAEAQQPPTAAPRQESWARRAWSQLWSWWLTVRRWCSRKLPANAETKIIDITPPEPALLPRLPERPRPKLAAVSKQPVGAVLDFLHDGLESVAGQRLEMAEAFVGYTAWCKTKSMRPTGLAEFVEEVEELCQECGIRIHSEEGLDYLVNVRLAKPAERAGSQRLGSMGREKR